MRQHQTSNHDLRAYGMRHDHVCAVGANTIYRGCMGRLLLIVLAALVVFMLVSMVISALHFLFWIAVLAVLIVGGLRLVGGARRWSRR